jgi:hypothetical protein
MQNISRNNTLNKQAHIAGAGRTSPAPDNVRLAQNASPVIRFAHNVLSDRLNT